MYICGNGRISESNKNRDRKILSTMLLLFPISTYLSVFLCSVILFVGIGIPLQVFLCSRCI